jgi:hypothetical protein
MQRHNVNDNGNIDNNQPQCSNHVSGLRHEVQRRELTMLCYKEFSRILLANLKWPDDLIQYQWANAIDRAWERMRSQGVDMSKHRRPSVQTGLDKPLVTQSRPVETKP